MLKMLLYIIKLYMNKLENQNANGLKGFTFIGNRSAFFTYFTENSFIISPYNDNKHIEYDFNGQCGSVTGAASGIGKAIASLLARSGASLALVDRNKTGLEAICAEPTGAAATEPLRDVLQIVTSAKHCCQRLETYVCFYLASKRNSSARSDRS